MAKRKLLGCSFPLAIALGVFFLILFLIGFAAGPLGRGIIGDIGLPSWLIVSQPHPELPAEAVFHVFGFPVTNSLLATWITMIFLIALSFAITRRMRLVPRRWQALLEFVVGSLLNFCQSVAGERNGRRFFPLVATIFLFVAVNAWLGLLPIYGSILVETSEGEAHLLRAANTDINTPLAIAIISFFAVGYFGLRSLGAHFLTTFFNFGPLFNALKNIFTGKLRAGLGGLFNGVISIFIGLIESISYMVRIISFTLRLFGNMTAGEILLLMATFLVPFLFALPFYGLELLVGFVQALIFAGLTLIFLTVAVTPHGGESH